MARLFVWFSLVIGIWPCTLAFGQSTSHTPADDVAPPPSEAAPTAVPASSDAGSDCPCKTHAAARPDPAAGQNTATRSQNADVAPPSQPSLAGPVIETVAGGVILASASFATALALGVTLNINLCSPDEEADCDRHSDQDERLMRRALGVGIPVALFGAALLVHGAYRTRQVKQQRRRLALEGIALDVLPHGASLRWQARF